MTDKKAAEKTQVNKVKLVKKDGTEKAIVDKNIPEEPVVFEGKFYYGIGRRKRAIAQVRLYPVEKSTDSGLVINGKKIKKYFPTTAMQNTVTAPLRTVGLYNKCQMSAKAMGGGAQAQAEAIRLGISRALIEFDVDFRAALKAEGFLKRDARKVERKKPGLKKARRSPQWAKR